MDQTKFFYGYRDKFGDNTDKTNDIKTNETDIKNKNINDSNDDWIEMKFKKFKTVFVSKKSYDSDDKKVDYKVCFIYF